MTTRSGEERLPNFLIAGVPKAATTSIASVLGGHPEVYGAPLKEAQYFMPLRYGEPLPPRSAYVAHFRDWSGERVVMDATPGYFYGGRPMVEAVRGLLGEPRVLIVLREPVARALSFFRWQKSRLQLPQDLQFTDYLIRYDSMSESELLLRSNNAYWGVHGGYYARWLPAWAGAFDLRVAYFEDFVRDPLSFANEVVDWLGLPPGPMLERAWENETTAVRSRTLLAAGFRVSRRFRSAFVRFPALKRGLKTAYARVNSRASGRAENDDIPAGVHAVLTRRFVRANEDLDSILRSRGLETPPWLDG